MSLRLRTATRTRHGKDRRRGPRHLAVPARPRGARHRPGGKDPRLPPARRRPRHRRRQPGPGPGHRRPQLRLCRRPAAPVGRQVRAPDEQQPAEGRRAGKGGHYRLGATAPHRAVQRRKREIPGDQAHADGASAGLKALTRVLPRQGHLLAHIVANGNYCP
ncbi:hypothetical protein CBM2615_B170166 [Cupriavidus taiwanensis]|uniref:Uncharacterized protein n=1 Tax=Cupriavidus taiwanensis TaxID=164546 RepID=A0A976B163_9BURK|nr:hypothetical protein CBM2615_B170166 [Cupriavidus taiwanensis]SOZ69455.1 hypothetical protein CBM2613_B140163 [Cupriavidus taiwanensis]